MSLPPVVGATLSTSWLNKTPGSAAEGRRGRKKVPGVGGGGIPGYNWHWTTSWGVTSTAIQPGTYGTGFIANAVVETPSEVYAPSVGTQLAKIGQLGPDAVGDPQDVVEAILFAADAANPPLRLAVGVEALTTIRESLQKQLRELDAVTGATQP